MIYTKIIQRFEGSGLKQHKSVDAHWDDPGKFLSIT